MSIFVWFVLHIETETNYNRDETNIQNIIFTSYVYFLLALFIIDYILHHYSDSTDSKVIDIAHKTKEKSSAISPPIHFLKIIYLIQLQLSMSTLVSNNLIKLFSYLVIKNFRKC